MKGSWILLKKELKDVFASPLIYVLTGLFSALMGWLFYNYLVGSSQQDQLSLSDAVLRPLFGNMNFVFLFFTPLITMRAFAEEKKQHTLELLFLSELKDLENIVGKFLACLIMASFMLLFTLIFPIILSFSGFSDWGMVGSSYLGILFSVSCYTAVGLFMSSLTKNQILAAISSFCLLLAVMLLVVTANATENMMVGRIVEYFSVPFHFEQMVRGSLRSYNVAYFASFLGFFFYLTHQSLGSRRW